jgi:hypothetical protein
MDAFVRGYIHENLRRRFVIVRKGPTAQSYQATIKDGD